MSTNFPPVKQIFDDLDKYRDFCRYEGKSFNEADLYNNKSYVWKAYQKYLGWLRAKARRNSRPQQPRRT